LEKERGGGPQSFGGEVQGIAGMRWEKVKENEAAGEKTAASCKGLKGWYGPGGGKKLRLKKSKEFVT